MAPPALVLGTKACGWAVSRPKQRAGRTVEVVATCLGALDILDRERLVGYDERTELLARVLEASGRLNRRCGHGAGSSPE